MTLPSELVKVSYDGDDSTATFPVTFVFWDEDDLRVILTEDSDVETVWIRGTQYTVTKDTPTGATTGNVVIVTTPTDYTPATGTTLTIKSNLSNTQDTSLPLGGQFPSPAVEQELDQITRLIQQSSEELDRTMKFPENELAASIGDLPILTVRKSNYLFFDANGKPTASEGITTGVIGVDVQAWDAQLDDIAALTPTDGNFIVGDGTDWVAESGNIARTSLDLGTGDSPTFSVITAEIDSATGAQIIARGATDTNNRVYIGYNTTSDYGRIQAITEGTSVRPLILNESGGNVGIGITSPDGTQHVHTATAGTVTASVNSDDLVVENSGSGGISVLVPDANIGFFAVGSPSNNTLAYMACSYNSGNPYLELWTDNDRAIRIHDSQNVSIGGAVTDLGSAMDIGGSLKMAELANAVDDTAGYGQLWVKNDTPCNLRFTDDAGTDFYIGVSSTTTGGSGSGGAGNQYIELKIAGTTYKVLHDGTV